MKNLGIYLLIISCFFFIGLHKTEAREHHDYYKTYEVIKIAKNGLTIRDNHGNVIELNKNPEGYKVGYKVRYDKIRNRLRLYWWQDYQVVAISDTMITLQHKTGDILTVKGNYQGEYNIGDQVSYDSAHNKLKEITR